VVATGSLTARQVAYEVVRRTFESGAYADRAFDRIAAGLEPRERRQAMRLAFGAVQRMRTVDHAVETLGGRRPGRLQAELRNALRVAGYEVLFSDSVPARAAVNEGVELAKEVAGARVGGLANAVLRRIAEAGTSWVDGLPPGLRYSYPDWVLEEWTAMLGDEHAARLAEAQNQPPELAVRVNTLRTPDVELEVPVRLDPELPEARVIEAAFDVAASRAFLDGLIWPQSRASMLPARALAPEPAMRVLDLCAAPGGKTGHLAALMENRGEIVAVERHAGRAGQLRETLDRLGATCARVEVADAFDIRDGGFDRILLDPPCSGLGVLGGRPDARWRRTLEGAHEVADLQRRLLDHARSLLAPGGRLVYSVCTVRREEGEGVLPGGRQTLPHIDGTDGFYVAATG
jgi:16S rRNA (cytosine967-C5)-methyltransferase